jgi:hypothetical protein
MLGKPPTLEAARGRRSDDAPYISAARNCSRQSQTDRDIEISPRVSNRLHHELGVLDNSKHRVGAVSGQHGVVATSNDHHGLGNGAQQLVRGVLRHLDSLTTSQHAAPLLPLAPVIAQ